MDILAQAAADRKATIETHGREITLTDEASNEYTVDAEVFRIDAKVDPQTDIQFYDPQTIVNISYDAIAATPEVGWGIAITDSTETVLTGRVSEVRIDRTIGLITIVVEELT